MHYHKTHTTALVIRHSKYLTNLVEHDHSAVKRLVRPMLGFKSIWSARCTIAGIKVMPAARKGQFVTNRTKSHTPAAQCSVLAAEVTRSENSITSLSLSEDCDNTSELPVDYDLAPFIHPVKLKHLLCHISPEWCAVQYGSSLSLL